MVNPNIATIQTSEGFADKVYYIPVEKDFVSRLFVRNDRNILVYRLIDSTSLIVVLICTTRYFIKIYEVLGTSVDNILKTEDRDLFAKVMTVIGEFTPISFLLQILKKH